MRDDTYVIRDDSFVRMGDGAGLRSISVSGIGERDSGWEARQEAGLQEYGKDDETEGARVPDDVIDPSPKRAGAYLNKLFRGYLAEAIVRFPAMEPAILDVGCGISPRIPEYVGHLSQRSVYVGLDPLDDGRAREYLFVHGRLEDLGERLEDRSDLFLFVTSLDHFRDLAETAHLVRGLAAPGASALFFIGLHDPDIVARQMGRDKYGQVFRDLSPRRFARNWVGTALKSLPATYRSLRRRRRMLAGGEPLDAFHFHYFTTDDIHASLAPFGNLEDLTLVPGTNAVFATVRVGA